MCIDVSRGGLYYKREKMKTGWEMKDKVALLKETISHKWPSLRGVNCQKCGLPMPPIIIHGVGKIKEKFVAARHFLGKCRNCGAWHRYDERAKSWIADESATKLATTKYHKSANITKEEIINN